MTINTKPINLEALRDPGSNVGRFKDRVMHSFRHLSDRECYLRLDKDDAGYLDKPQVVVGPEDSLETKESLTGQSDPVSASRYHNLVKQKGVVKKLKRAYVEERKRALAEAKSQCRKDATWVTFRYRWKKLGYDVFKRPKYKIKSNIVGWKSVKRRKLLKKWFETRVIRYWKREVVKWRRTPAGDRPVYHRHLVTKRVTYVRKKWRIWSVRVPIIFGQRKIQVGFKYWKKQKRVRVVASQKAHVDWAYVSQWKPYYIDDAMKGESLQAKLRRWVEAGDKCKSLADRFKAVSWSGSNRMLVCASNSLWRSGSKKAGEPSRVIDPQPFIGPEIRSSLCSLPVARGQNESHTPRPGWFQYGAQPFFQKGVGVQGVDLALVEGSDPYYAVHYVASWGSNAPIFSTNVPFRLFNLSASGSCFREDAWATRPLAVLNPEDAQLQVSKDDAVTVWPSWGSDVGKFKEACSAAADRLLTGDVGRDPFDGYVSVRSLAELKDFEGSLGQFREMIQFLKGAFTGEAEVAASIGRAEAFFDAISQGKIPAAYLQSGGRRTLKGVAMPKGWEEQTVWVKKNLGKAARVKSCLAFMAASYCMWKFAAEPTINDIQTVLSGWHEALFESQRALKRLARSLSPDVPSIRLRALARKPISDETLRWKEDGYMRRSVPGVLFWGENPLTQCHCLYFRADDKIRFPDPVELVSIPAMGDAQYPDLVSKGAYAYLFPDIPWSTVKFICDQDVAAVQYMSLNREEYERYFGDRVDARGLAASLLSASKWTETAWELVPMSFVVNWFVTTAKTVRAVQTWQEKAWRGTAALQGRIWSSQRALSVKSKSRARVAYVDLKVGKPDEDSKHTFRLLSGEYDPQKWDPKDWKQYGSLTGYERLRCEMTVESRYDETTECSQVFKPVNCLRAPFEAPDSRQRISWALPKIRMNLNAGKITSLGAIAAGFFKP